jgi:hypothetical protein
MAKKPETKPETEETKSALPAVQEQAGLPAASPDMFEEDAGAGTTDATMRDQVIPFYRIIQSLSPQRKKSDPVNFIKEAEEGDLINTATRELFKGENGIHVIMVDFARRYTEWKPRDKGGGLVADYGDDETCLAKRKTKPNEKGRMITPEGNEIILSGNHFCIRVDPETGNILDRGVFSMSSTYLKKSREWITTIKNIQIANSKGKFFNPASFYMVYHVKTVLQSNQQGEWFNFQIDPYKPVTELPGGMDLYMSAKKFYEEIRKGTVQVAATDDRETADADVPF